MSEDAAPKARISRRTLLAAAAVAGGTAVVGGLASSQGGPPTPSAMRSRTLGRTGLKVSEIGFGGYPMDDPDVLVYALERGINYVDTAHCYRGGASERAIGPALKGRRNRFVLTTKWCPHHIGKEPKRQVFLDMLDESLRRLGTDYVDIVLNHEVGRHSDGSGVERLKNPEMLEAFAVAKKAGKARFLGASGHDGDLPQVMGHAIDSGLFDVLLCRYSFLDYPEQQKLIDRAAAAGVGFIAMKTLAGAKGADLDRFRDRQTSFKQAALKWVLANPKLSNLIISISNRKQVDEYVAASGAPLAAADRALLDEYQARFSNEVCRFCNACEPACPDDVRIADILRFAMYFHDYGQEGRGVESYARLVAAERAAHCSHCAGFCEAACDYDLPVKSLLIRADAALSLSSGTKA
ncbi:MAG: Aldo ket red protein [Acidobacteriota bacterium]|nr:Aldo ket red protein [Acidobacteriota bacterium]